MVSIDWTKRTRSAVAVAWLAVLSTARAADADPTAPTRVTIHRQNAPAKDVLAEIGKQAGLDVILPDEAARTLTIDADARPFWDVLLDACRQIGCDPVQGDVQSVDGRPTLRLVAAGGAGLDLTATGGPAVAAFTRIEHTSHLITAAIRRETTGVSVRMRWEPKFKALFYERMPLPDEAVDDAGHSLMPAVDDARRGRADDWYAQLGSGGGFQGSAVELTVLLRVPTDASRRIAKLRGKLRVFTGKAASVDVANLKSLKTNTVVDLGNGNSVKLQSPTVSASSVRLHVRIDRKPGEADAAWQQRRMLLKAGSHEIRDAGGGLWSQLTEYSGSSWGDKEMSVYLEADRRDGVQSEPATLTLIGFEAAVAVEVPYDFSNLPLP